MDLVHESITHAIIKENYLPLDESANDLNASSLVRDLLEYGDISDNKVDYLLNAAKIFCKDSLRYKIRNNFSTKS